MEQNHMTESVMDRRQTVRNYIQENGGSQAAFARSIGVSESYISRWFAGKLDNDDGIDQKVDEFFKKTEERSKLASTEQLAFAPTAISSTIWNTLNYCRLQRFIGCIVGDAGIGKTRTIHEWAAGKTDVYIVTATVVARNPKSFFKLLARKFQTTTTGTVDDIYFDLTQKIMGRDITLIIDEAQHLKFDTLEQIRDLNDQYNVSIVLVGNPKINKTLSGKRKEDYAQITSRIKMPQTLLKDSFTLNDMTLIFPGLEDSSYKFLLHVAQRGSGLRDAMTVYINSTNNNDISVTGLRAMASFMRISA